MFKYYIFVIPSKIRNGFPHFLCLLFIIIGGFRLNLCFHSALNGIVSDHGFFLLRKEFVIVEHFLQFISPLPTFSGLCPEFSLYIVSKITTKCLQMLRICFCRGKKTEVILNFQLTCFTLEIFE